MGKSVTFVTHVHPEPDSVYQNSVGIRYPSVAPAVADKCRIRGDPPDGVLVPLNGNRKRQVTTARIGTE
jgi:hypothetical protein